MTATGFRRVSKKRPCCVCGKPDWCSTTQAETISFCARSTLSADRVSRRGWGVYYHEPTRSVSDRDSERNFDRFRKPEKTRISKNLAPRAIRDKVYRKLIELSPASSNYKIVNGRGGLLERGIRDLAQYGNIPRLVYERRVLTERLVDAMAKEGIRSFQGVPGFWRDANGGLRLWSGHDSLEDLMLIPFAGPDGLIRACQIRFMRYMPNKSGRYVWLSSSKEKDGCGPGSPLHHADPCFRSAKPVLVTEGALKAATAQRFLPDKYVVGNSGVATSHKEIVETARRRSLEIAFDQDSFTNPHVARSLAALLRHRYSDEVNHGYNDDVRVLTWDTSFKGVDEALLAGARLLHRTPCEWFKHLSPECSEKENLTLALLSYEKGGRQVASWADRSSRRIPNSL